MVDYLSEGDVITFNRENSNREYVIYEKLDLEIPVYFFAGFNEEREVIEIDSTNCCFKKGSEWWENTEVIRRIDIQDWERKEVWVEF